MITYLYHIVSTYLRFNDFHFIEQNKDFKHSTCYSKPVGSSRDTNRYRDC